MPVLGFLNAESAKGYASPLAAFLKGLGEAGFVEGRNVAIEYRWADGHSERLPDLAADLVLKRVNVIAATSTPAAIAAKSATTSIPVVFETASDPIRLGLVESLSRPSGNVTGVTQTNVEVAPKRLEVIHELLPNVRVLGLVINPADPSLAEPQTRDFQAAAHALGVELRIFNARDDDELEKAFRDVSQMHIGALVISTDPFFTSRPDKLANLAVRYELPAVSKGREFAAAGGLLSYGADTLDTYRLAGVYTGRVLKGEKPGDLPVQQATKVELYINLRTAKALGVSIPLPLSGRADEIFE
jgi:putative ABC transport system substrate-binding protein